MLPQLRKHALVPACLKRYALLDGQCHDDKAAIGKCVNASWPNATNVEYPCLLHARTAGHQQHRSNLILVSSTNVQTSSARFLPETRLPRIAWSCIPIIHDAWFTIIAHPTTLALEDHSIIFLSTVPLAMHAMSSIETCSSAAELHEYGKFINIWNVSRQVDPWSACSFGHEMICLFHSSDTRWFACSTLRTRDAVPCCILRVIRVCLQSFRTHKDKSLR